MTPGPAARAPRGAARSIAREMTDVVLRHDEIASPEVLGWPLAREPVHGKAVCGADRDGRRCGYPLDDALVLSPAQLLDRVEEHAREAHGAA